MNILIPYSDKTFVLLKMKFRDNNIDIKSKSQRIRSVINFKFGSVVHINGVNFFITKIDEKSTKIKKTITPDFILFVNVNEKEYNSINEALSSLLMSPLKINIDDVFSKIPLKCKIDKAEESILFTLDEDFNDVLSINSLSVEANKKYCLYFKEEMNM